MGNVIPFPARPRPEDGFESDAEFDIDLMTAVDVAIRDLRDLMARLEADEAGRRQAGECLSMLARALAGAQAAVS